MLIKFSFIKGLNTTPPSSNGQSHQSSTSILDSPETYETLDVTLAQIINQDANTCVNALADIDELMKDKERYRLLGENYEHF